MTPHPLITRAIARVRKQGEPAYCNGACQLLANNGLRCAVGGLIDPRDITSKMEGAAVPDDPDSEGLREAIQHNNPDLDLPVDDHTDPLWMTLGSVQEAHDTAATPPAGSSFMEHFERTLKDKRVLG